MMVALASELEDVGLRGLSPTCWDKEMSFGGRSDEENAKVAEPYYTEPKF